ncbi:Na+/H+ antiporter subunit C [Venatoribacter cucullus]|nr:Na+/H+ antiporter subunit C [Venatoribacter cucullus]
MEFTFALGVGVLTTAGIYLMLRGQTFPVIVGLTLLSYAVNLFLFASGRLTVNGAAIVGQSEVYTDPLPQALVLTAIVIGFAMTAFVLILAMRARSDLGNDHVDGRTMPQARETGAGENGKERKTSRKSATRTELRDTKPRKEPK